MKINVKAQSNRCFRGISIGVFVGIFSAKHSFHIWRQFVIFEWTCA